jgi:hypothetical protein
MFDILTFMDETIFFMVTIKNFFNTNITTNLQINNWIKD